MAGIGETPSQRVGREDLVLFINAAFSCTRQHEFYTDARGGQRFRTRALVRETSHHIFEITRAYMYRADETEPFATAGTSLRD